ncbi:hypothetical protein NM208_g14092 [Fusarium decemcellulare]|uniref:Uncharacterized protein n=1 Tax=Fusarium decemcellulare TaxID=57161 RepID=A0ACC1RLI4_9HYPO|nr:hypothetical protein NM208_g14092 [Fusarium decemcellulare]
MLQVPPAVDEASVTQVTGSSNTSSIGSSTEHHAHQAQVRASSSIPTTASTPALPTSVDASKYMIQQHVDAFFRYVYSTSVFNFIHRGSFLRSWHKGRLSPSLLRTVAGVASRYMDLAHGPAKDWLEETERSILADWSLISIPKLQMLLLLIFNRIMAAELPAAWFLMSMAARIAHGL